MSQPRHRRIAELFGAAVELQGAEREAYLARECPDDALRAEVLELLEHDTHPRLSASGVWREGMLDQALRATPPGASETASTRIGPYRLLECIGVGGMGEVWAAEQLQPVQRRVALKLIKPGMDSAQVVARFEAERQALARMSHPNVAQVLDAGTTDGGRPYFVMEYVAGEPITDSCDRRKLSTRQRVELFLDVCAGVQHAHQKGLVHRDLKPSNLLVTTGEGLGRPKVIDFGVARAVTGQLSERMQQTMLGQVVGTLDYMSPEQADPTSVDIDTRSDIYSLGVVLYQLVSGLLPFEFNAGGGMPLSEVQRTIREKEPPTPSTRLHRQGATATDIASRRGTDGHSLVRQLHGDLDWICLKALEKDPARRYASASELADDLRRYLAYEPVLAGRPGAMYRLRKFVRRNRIAVAAGVLVAAGLVAGVVGIVTGRIEAEASAIQAAAERASVLRQSAAVKIQELRGLLGEADDELWPITMEKLAAYDDWLLRAEALVASLDPAPDGSHPGFRRQLGSLRARALPRTAEQRQADRERQPEYKAWSRRKETLEAAEAELAAKRVEVQRAEPGEEQAAQAGALLAQADEQLAAERQELATLDAQLETRRSYTFAQPGDAVWDAQLTELIQGVEDLSEPRTGLIAGDEPSAAHGWSVRRRRDFAPKLLEDSLTSPQARDRWVEATASIADRDECPAYAGLELTPQYGLLPIGRDPQSGLWEFAHLMSGEPAQRDSDTGRIVPTPEMGVVLVLLPAGTFWMGAQRVDETAPNFDPQLRRWKARLESPVHEWPLDAYFMSKYELTRGQWKRLAGQLPRPIPGDPTNSAPYPVRNLRLQDADRIATWVGLTLPDEEQWEYAARAGTNSSWWTGLEEASLNGAENLWDLSAAVDVVSGEPIPGATSAEGEAAVPWDDRSRFEALVGSYRPNPFGLHDVLGNVSEWCFTHRIFYDLPPVRPAQRNLEWGVARGGSFMDGAYQSRCASRAHANPVTFVSEVSGFRPIRNIAP